MSTDSAQLAPAAAIVLTPQISSDSPGNADGTLPPVSAQTIGPSHSAGADDAHSARAERVIQQFQQGIQQVQHAVFERLQHDYYTSNRYYRLRNKTNDPIELHLQGDTAIDHPITIQGQKGKVLDGNTLIAIGREVIRRYEELEQLSVRDLVIDVGANYIIHNETADLISIQTYEQDPQHSEALIIPPFGSRWLSSEFLKDYDFLNWKRTKLILVDLMIDKKPDQAAQVIKWLLASLFGLFILASAASAILGQQTINWMTFGITSAVFVVLLAASHMMSLTESERKNIATSVWEWLKLTPGIGMILLAGVGLPLWIVYEFGEGQRLLGSSDFSLVLLGRLIQVGFISVAAILPALLYYLFGRQQIEKLREGFFREVVVLDPHVHTLSEARTKYDPLLDSVYGAGNSNSPFAIVLLVVSTALLVMGWVMVLLPIGPAPVNTAGLIAYITPNYTVFTLGFLGTYFFAVNLIFRRYVRADLTPKTYAYITVRLLITLVLVWAISAMPEFASGTAIQAGLLTIAFVIGVFPETGLALIMNQWRKITRMRSPGTDATFPLSDLEGMNLYDQARLLEEGIENIENLAHHNLVEMMARTRLPTARLVDMFDQAILYLHLGIVQGEEAADIDGKTDAASMADKKSLTGKALLNQFKSYGIRTATDLIECMPKDGDCSPQALAAIFDIERLKVIVRALQDDEWLDYIMNWRSASRRNDPITNPYGFYYAGSPKDSIEHIKGAVAGAQ